MTKSSREKNGISRLFTKTNQYAKLIQIKINSLVLKEIGLNRSLQKENRFC